MTHHRGRAPQASDGGHAASPLLVAAIELGITLVPLNSTMIAVTLPDLQ